MVLHMRFDASAAARLDGRRFVEIDWVGVPTRPTQMPQSRPAALKAESAAKLLCILEPPAQCTVLENVPGPTRLIPQKLPKIEIKTNRVQQLNRVTY
jgi:hypothetical protein